MRVKRTAFRNLARRKPGYITEKALQQMLEHVEPPKGEAASDLPPVVFKYLSTAFMPNFPIKDIGNDMYRQMRTLSEGIDLLLKGENLRALDLLMGRLKACQQWCKDRNWSSARWYELIPPEESHLAFAAEEEEIVHGIEAREIKHSKMLGNIKG